MEGMRLAMKVLLTMLLMMHLRRLLIVLEQPAMYQLLHIKLIEQTMFLQVKHLLPQYM